MFNGPVEAGFGHKPTGKDGEGEVMLPGAVFESLKGIEAQLTFGIMDAAFDKEALGFALGQRYKGCVEGGIGENIAAADPATGEPTCLLRPRRNTWADHFTLNGAIIEPQTAEGRATEFVLHLNDLPRIEQREVLIQLDRYPCPA